MHPSRVAGIFLAFVVLAVFTVSMLFVVVLPLFVQINELLVKVPEYSKQMQGDSLLNLLKDPSAKVAMLPSNLEGLIEDAVNSVMGLIAGVIRNLLNSTIQIVANLLGLIVVPFLSFYFLKDWHQLCEMVVSLFTPVARPKARRVLHRIGVAISSYVEGLWKLSLLSALCVVLILMILQVPYPLVFGFIAMFAEAIPVIGPIIAAVPAVFVAYSCSVPSGGFLSGVFLHHLLHAGQSGLAACHHGPEDTASSGGDFIGADDRRQTFWYFRHAVCHAGSGCISCFI